MTDRLHQGLVRARFAEIASGQCTDTSTLLDVCPGGGKSACVSIAVEELYKANRSAGLIWLVPRASLAAQSRKGFNAHFESIGSPLQVEAVRSCKHGRALQQRRRGSSPKLSASSSVGPFGFVSTYQRFSSKRASDYALQVSKVFRRRAGLVLVALDELHHCSADEEQSWTQGVKTLERELQRHGVAIHLLNMSGTLYRKDQQPILNVLYENGEPKAHITYSFSQGRTEKAVLPPEIIYVDGPVVLKRGDRQRIYSSMKLLPDTHQARLRKAFLQGAILKPQVSVEEAPDTTAQVEEGHDSREVTSLWLMRYGIDHFIAKRAEYNYPLQTIVVAHSAAAAIGYCSWLRRNYPELRTAVSLSALEVSTWGHNGFRSVGGPLTPNLLIDHKGNRHDITSTIEVMGAVGENNAIWYEDPQTMIHGLLPGNYNLDLTDPELRGEGDEWKSLPSGEQVIRAFQSTPKNGENVVDILVTVGKAYEGLDAPRCSHLICLARHRSAPWLAQCFARAWRYDYKLAAAGVPDQRCWIFAPSDKEMVQAVERIVWDAPLAGAYKPSEQTSSAEELESIQDEDSDIDPTADAEYDEDGDTDSIELIDTKTLELLTLQEQIELANALEAEANESSESDEGEEAEDDPDEGGEVELPPEPKPRPEVKAFHVIDRVRHEFVSDSTRQMVVLKDEPVVHEILAP